MVTNKLRLFIVLFFVAMNVFANTNKSPELLRELKTLQQALRVVEAELMNDELIAMTAAKTWEQSQGEGAIAKGQNNNMAQVWAKAEIEYDNMHVIRSLKMNVDLRMQALRSMCSGKLNCVQGDELREAIVLNKMRIANLYRGQIAKIQVEILGAK